MANGGTFENGGFLRGGLEGVRLLLPLSSIHPELVVRQEGPLWPDVDGAGIESSAASGRSAASTIKKIYENSIPNHLIEIWGIGNGPNVCFWISINGKRIAIAYESPLASAKEIVDLKLRDLNLASHLRA